MGALKIFIYGFNFSLKFPVTVSAMALGNMQLASISLLFINFIYSAWSQMFALGLFQPRTGRLTEANPC